MWNMECIILPVIIVATETVTERLKKIESYASTFTTKDSFTWNITCNKDSNAV
jgi:hypothetical protein